MKSLERTGRTVEEAVEAALAELGVSRDQCEVEILEEGNKGLFGLLGARPARVRVTVKAASEQPEQGEQDAVERGRVFLSGLLERMNVPAAVETRVDDDGTVIMNVTGSDLGVVIGARGQTLDAVQYLVNVVANKDAPSRVRIVVDAEGYRERRAEAVRRMALRAAEKAKAAGKRVRLDPMSAVERRLVHLALRDDDQVETRSEGTEPYRRVVIVPRV